MNPTVPPAMYTQTSFAVDPAYADGRYHALLEYDREKYAEEGITLESPAFFDGLVVSMKASDAMEAGAASNHYLDKAAYLVIFPSDSSSRYAFTHGESRKDLSETEFAYLKGIVYDSNQKPYEQVYVPLPRELSLWLREKKGELTVAVFDTDAKVIAVDQVSYGQLDGSRPVPNVGQ